MELPQALVYRVNQLTPRMVDAQVKKTLLKKSYVPGAPSTKGRPRRVLTQSREREISGQ
jgi:hypothetical protein